MYIKRLLYNSYSKLVISIILGFGLATLFRRACNSKSCYDFVAPHAYNVEKNVYEYDDKYYKFIKKNVKCDTNKKIISFA